MGIIISGIQQMGIGVPNVEEIWKFYRTNFGINVKVFEDEAEAPLMTRYTGGVVQNRTATLALSLEGGGGMEIWQYKSRNTEKANFAIHLGDLGLYSCRIKSKNVAQSYEFHKKNGVKILGELGTTPAGKQHYFVEDPNGNIFDICDSQDWFANTKFPGATGGVGGSMIGVSDMDKSIQFYKEILEYDTVEYD
ncbi:MAG: VOC family protein, partial [Crocinitomicaceae bacterium]|nr:VOC family protein [Crocinitomicaceae bacterium]